MKLLASFFSGLRYGLITALGLILFAVLLVIIAPSLRDVEDDE